ncbi:MAG: helix-turn-helix domain-containing protein [Holosporales bacterium]
MIKHPDKTILIRFGQKIRQLRHEKSLSQEELADLAGVHRTYIGMIERGEKNVTIVTMLRLSEALGLRVSDLTKGFDDGQ